MGSPPWRPRRRPACRHAAAVSATSSRVPRPQWALEEPRWDPDLPLFGRRELFSRILEPPGVSSVRIRARTRGQGRAGGRAPVACARSRLRSSDARAPSGGRDQRSTALRAGVRASSNAPEQRLTPLPRTALSASHHGTFWQDIRERLASGATATRARARARTAAQPTHEGHCARIRNCQRDGAMARIPYPAPPLLLARSLLLRRR